jgi:hypothetical protein
MTSANLGGPRGPWGQTGGAYSSAGSALLKSQGDLYLGTSCPQGSHVNHSILNQLALPHSD